MKKILLKIKGWFMLLFGGEAKFEAFLKDHADDAIQFVETIKGFVHSDVVISLMIIFPKYAKMAKPYLDKAEEFLNELISRMGIADKCLDIVNTVERIKCMVDVIKGKNDLERSNIYQEMAVNYIQLKSKEYTVDGKEISMTAARKITTDKYAELQATKAGAKEAAEL